MNIILRLRKQKMLVVFLLALVLLLGLTATTQAAPTQQTGGVYHTIRWGETLSGIARLYGTTTQAILAANPHIWNPNLIFAGTVLFIPSGSVPPAPPPPPTTYCRFYHTVRYGDNLNRISTWYGTNPWSIAQANRIYNLNLIYAGQVLCIP
ncbi:MAG: LysM peptidoglycan-binding domain-containing protein [Chloroflexi bacterium]|nr:LysM peptidoglycan-binding domain-containing protein [Chloroflexota bacterium]